MKTQEYLGISLALALPGAGAAQASTEVIIYKNPTCGCCERYANYLRENVFAAKTANETSMDSIKKHHGVSRIASCHTASVPGMQMNSPGMGEGIFDGIHSSERRKNTVRIFS
jgi:hypothetical protein